MSHYHSFTVEITSIYGYHGKFRNVFAEAAAVLCWLFQALMVCFFFPINEQMSSPTAH